MPAPKKVLLNKSYQKYARVRHPWVYKSQIQTPLSTFNPGEIVSVSTADHTFLGTGYINEASQITIRLLSFREVVIDQSFIRSKIEKALRYRKKFVRDTNAMRLISSEADELPGLIVDQYAEVLVVQFLTYGMENLRELVLKTLEEIFPNCGIYEKSDAPSRKLEGLSERCAWIRQDCGGEIEVYEGDVRYKMSLAQGHKTGFYLDQRENRRLLEGLKIKGNVLDCFCFTGGFGLGLAKHADHVLGIDSQKEVIAMAEENRRLNNIDEGKLEFKTANVFDELKAFDKEGRKFNLVILDPPSFVRKKDALDSALAGFKEIILRSLKILHDEGQLAVFSCSYHVDEGLLMQVCQEAALDVKKNLKVLRFMKQSIDHPINPFIPETYYLKGFLFGVEAI